MKLPNDCEDCDALMKQYGTNGFAIMADSRGHYYYIPANIESEFQTCVDTGRAHDLHGDFGDFRVEPMGAMTKMFLTRRFVN